MPAKILALGWKEKMSEHSTCSMKFQAFSEVPKAIFVIHIGN